MNAEKERESSVVCHTAGAHPDSRGHPGSKPDGPFETIAVNGRNHRQPNDISLEWSSGFDRNHIPKQSEER